MRARVAIVFVIIALAYAGAYAQESAPPERRIFDFTTWEHAPDTVAPHYVESAREKVLRETTAFFIPSFRVEFATASMVATFSREGGGYQTTADRKELVTVLEGVSDADFQRITDRAYHHFVAELKRRGYRVLSWKAVTTRRLTGNLLDWAHPKPLVHVYGDRRSDERGEYKIFGPAHMPLYSTATEPGGKFMQATKVDSPEMTEPVLIRDMNAAMLKATFRVDYAQFYESTPEGMTRRTASTLFTPGMDITAHAAAMPPDILERNKKRKGKPGEYRLSDFPPKLRLKIPISLSDKFVTDSKLKKRVNIMNTSVLADALTVDPHAYERAALKGLSAASELLVYTLRANKDKYAR